MNAFLRCDWELQESGAAVFFSAGSPTPLPTPTREVREQTRALLDLARTNAIVQMGQASRLLAANERGADARY